MDHSKANMHSYNEFSALPEAALAHRLQQAASDSGAISQCKEIAWALMQHGQSGVLRLYDQLPHANTAQLVGIMFALTHPHAGAPLAEDSLLAWLDDARDSVVAEAIDGLSRSGYLDQAERVLQLKNHPSHWVRGSVVRFASQLAAEQAQPLWLAALDDPHFVVRENAVDEIGDHPFRQALSHLQALLDDEHPDVREATRTAIDAIHAMEPGEAS